MFASSVSWFSFCWNYFCDPLEPHPRNDLVLEMAEGFYRHPLEVFGSRTGPNHLFIDYSELTGNLKRTIEKIYRHFSIPLSSDFRRYLEKKESASRRFRSGHAYSLEEQGLSERAVEEALGDAYGSLLE
jgi:hypothetical protein